MTAVSAYNKIRTVYVQVVIISRWRIKNDYFSKGSMALHEPATSLNTKKRGIQPISGGGDLCA